MLAEDGSIEIPLSKGKVAVIDAEDFELIGRHKWHCLRARKAFYAVRKVRQPDGRQRTLRMHTAITGFAVVDHIDGDGLNNRRANLREATVRQNNRNLRKTTGHTSQYKGVSLYKSTAKWCAQIRVNGRTIGLGHHADEVAAAVAYDRAARLYFGEFAALNFPGPGEVSAHPGKVVISGHKIGAERRDEIRRQAQRDAALVVEEFLNAADNPFESIADRAEYARQFQVIAIRLRRQSGR